MKPSDPLLADHYTLVMTRSFWRHGTAAFGVGTMLCAAADRPGLTRQAAGRSASGGVLPETECRQSAPSMSRESSPPAIERVV